MGIILTLTLVYLVFLFFWVKGLAGRIKELEDKHLNTAELVAKDETTAPPVALVLGQANTPEQETQAATNPAPATFNTPEQSPTPTIVENSWLWFKEHTLIKIGAILFFWGAVWFVSYAVSQGWINPTLRILLGLLLGVFVHVIGHLRQSKSVGQYLTLTALGSGIIIASVFAGQFIFLLFPPALALLLLLGAIAYTIYVSLTTKTEWLTVAGAVTGLLAPLLINSLSPDANLFFAYLFALSLAFLLIVLTTSWRLVTLVLLLGVLGFQLIFWFKDDIGDSALWIFVLMFNALFYSATTTSLVRSKKSQPLDIATLGIIAVNLTVWTHALSEQAGNWVFGYALITAMTGYLTYNYLRHRGLAAIYTILTMFFLVAATTISFSGFTLIIAYTLEATALIAAFIYLQFTQKNCLYASLVYLLPIISSASALSSSAWESGALHPDAYSLYLIIASAFSLSGLAIYFGKRRITNFYLRLGGWFLTIGYGYTLITLWLVWTSVLGAERSGDISIATYLSWMAIIIALVHISLTAKLPLRWTTLLLFSLGLPLLTSLNSLLSNDWAISIAHNHALGIYTLIGLLTFLAVNLHHQLNKYQGVTDCLKTAIQLLWVLIGAYITILVWLIPHAIILDDDHAVAVTLLIYTVSGLLCYSIGKARLLKVLKIGGVVLLAGVIARLGLVDVWQMELFWRIITFFGVGTLFIGTALLEKSFAKEHQPQD